MVYSSRESRHLIHLCEAAPGGRALGFTLLKRLFCNCAWWHTRFWGARLRVKVGLCKRRAKKRSLCPLKYYYKILESRKFIIYSLTFILLYLLQVSLCDDYSLPVDFVNKRRPASVPAATTSVVQWALPSPTVETVSYLLFFLLWYKIAANIFIISLFPLWCLNKTNNSLLTLPQEYKNNDASSAAALIPFNVRRYKKIPS